MNFTKIFQFFAFVSLVRYGTMTEQEYSNCKITPSNVDKVDVLVYINGDTFVDVAWYSRYCSWKVDGFPFDHYAPITVKVGAAITCDNNNKCNCPNYDNNKVDCSATFQHVCAEQILGQEEFKKLLCCTAVITNLNTDQRRGFKKCVSERSGLQEKISTCMQKKGPGGPQDVAIRNAKEVANKGVDLTNNTEPFFFYNGIFDKCTSDDSPGFFLQRICLMLKRNKAKSIDQCVRAMGSHWT